MLYIGLLYSAQSRQFGPLLYVLFEVVLVLVSNRDVWKTEIELGLPYRPKI